MFYNFIPLLYSILLMNDVCPPVKYIWQVVQVVIVLMKDQDAKFLTVSKQFVLCFVINFYHTGIVKKWVEHLFDNLKSVFCSNGICPFHSDHSVLEARR